MADYDISNVTRRVVYAASGTGPYAFTFEILSQTDIDVYKGDTLLTLTTDYSVTINANGTGSVTLVVTAGTSNITIVGARNIQRTTDFVTGGDFFANTLNDELDSQTIFIQQVAETAERGLKAPVTDPTDINMTLPRKADRAGKYLAFDANGNPQPGDTAVEVAAIAAIADEIEAVAAIDTEVVAVAGNSSNINTVAGNNANITTVAGVSAAVTTVAANIVDIQNAEENADAAAASAILANDWATKTSGAVAGGEYSAKYHAQAASTSAGNASTSANNASTSATAAQNAQTAAESARDATLASFDSFDDRYLGSKTSNPTLDNDGNALLAGALYFNSVSAEMRVYTGSAWVAAYVSGTGFLSANNNLSDLANVGTARTNLGGTTVGNAVFTAATVAAAQQAMDVEVGVDVQAYDVDTAKTDVAQSYSKAQRGTPVALTSSSASIAVDFSLSNNFTHTFTENTTIANPSNMVAGQSGVIAFTQHASSPKTLAFGSYWDFPGGTVPSVTASNSARDQLVYYVESSTLITCRLLADVK